MYHGGRYSFVGYNRSLTDDHNWYYKARYPSAFENTRSWSVVVDQWNFLLYTYPGGVPKGSSTGNTTNPWTPNAMMSGDVLFYDWDSNGVKDHESIQVAMGTDPNSGYYGNLIDAHTTNRYHAIWTLKPWNSKYASTTIYFMHVDPANTGSSELTV